MPIVVPFTETFTPISGSPFPSATFPSQDNEIKITGRAKDTIVLLGGENIEPAVIEASLLNSPYIERVMIVGQDKKYIAALIVPAKDVLTEWANTSLVMYSS